MKVEQLVKVYPGGVRALDGVSFEVARGEFVVVVGLSGSGKSTLLRCINRLVEPTAGRVWVDGVEVTALDREGVRRLRREVGMVFQQFNLVSRLPVLTNVLTGRLGYLPPWWSLLNYWPRGVVQQALEALDRVGIRDKAYVRADQLSGGQQQRVGIARALMQEPKLILADEPVASLDPATSHSVLRYIEELNRREGITVLCSLHFLSLARRYGSRAIALKEGRVVFDGPPAEIDDRRFREIYGEDAVEVEIA